MNNETTTTSATADAAAAATQQNVSATGPTQQTTSTSRALRPRTTVGASTEQAGQAKPTQSKGKKPARNGGISMTRRSGAPAATNRSSTGSMSRTANLEPDYPTVAHPIFAVTVAPKVEDISHEALTRWVDLRLEYEEIMRARCDSSGEDLKSVMRSVKNSFDDSFLETLCETKWEKTKDELTDEFIWNWVMDTVRNFKNNALPNIDELFQDQLVMSTTKSDIDARVMDYFHLCNTIVKNNGLATLFSDEEGTKKKCKVLLNCLPGEMKDRVKNEIDFRYPGAKSNVSVLFKIVSEKALEIDREDKALSRNKSAAGLP